MARRRALEREGAKTVRLTPFANEFSPDFKMEVTQTLNTKVVQQVTIFKNAQGCMGFLSRVWAGTGAQVGQKLGASEQE
jgi:hypothetical protein